MIWRLVGIVVVVLSLGASAAVMVVRLTTESGNGDGRIDTIEYIPARWASAQAHDLPTLIDATGTVFVGTVLRVEDQRVEDLLPPAARAQDGSTGRGTVPVTVFRVSVKQVITGSAADEELVEQIAGTITGPDGSVTNVISDGDERLETGETYLFFSFRKQNGALTSPPFARFSIDEAGRLSIPGLWSDLGATRALINESVQSAASAVRASVN